MKFEGNKYKVFKCQYHGELLHSQYSTLLKF